MPVVGEEGQLRLRDPDRPGQSRRWIAKAERLGPAGKESGRDGRTIRGSRVRQGRHPVGRALAGGDFVRQCNKARPSMDSATGSLYNGRDHITMSEKI